MQVLQNSIECRRLLGNDNANQHNPGQSCGRTGRAGGIADLRNNNDANKSPRLHRHN